MFKMPLVSFIVTSYNYERYILKTLESIKSQTYSNFEIIIVDDCSDDNSYEICKNFVSQNQDLRITLIKNEINSGQLASMLNGLKLAKGQFVSFIDSDDVLFENYAQTHIKVHLETSVAFTSCQVAEIGEDDELHTLNSVSSPHSPLDTIMNCEKPNYEVLKNKRFGAWWWSPNSSAMYRKASIEHVCSYKNTDKWRICPDKFLFNFAHLVGASAVIYTPLVYYRRHSSNAGECTYVTGDKKLHSDKTTCRNIVNNINVRTETIKFLLQERKFFGNRNTISFILKILKSFFI